MNKNFFVKFVARIIFLPYYSLLTLHMNIHYEPTLPYNCIICHNNKFFSLQHYWLTFSIKECHKWSSSSLLYFFLSNFWRTLLWVQSSRQTLSPKVLNDNDNIYWKKKSHWTETNIRKSLLKKYFFKPGGSSANKA